MTRHAWLLVLGGGIVSGCGPHRTGPVSSDLLANLTARVAETTPEPDRPTSPSHVRGVAEAAKDEPVPPAPGLVQAAAPPRPAVETPDPLDARPRPNKPDPILSPSFE